MRKLNTFEIKKSVYSAHLRNSTAAAESLEKIHKMNGRLAKLMAEVQTALYCNLTFDAVLICPVQRLFYYFLKLFLIFLFKKR